MALQFLLQIASHPELHAPTSAEGAELVRECPKLAQSLAILTDIAGNGEKAVVFTRYLRMQDILQTALRDRFGLHAPILNGETASRRRVDLVDEFNQAEGFRVLILSPEAAGVGLNITGANHVIHYSRLWNPAREHQASDRVHRIGQTRPVTIHLPIITGGPAKSVEERLDELLGEKTALAHDIIQPRADLSVLDQMTDILGG